MRTDETTIYSELHRRTHLVHGTSKDEEALELARLMIRVLPSLESLVQQASYSSGGSVHGQTQSIRAFVDVATGLARFLGSRLG